MTESREVWAYVAHKEGKLVGVIAGRPPSDRVDPKEAARWKKEIASFCGGFIADGFEIARVYDRAEYEALVLPMPMWKREEAKPHCEQTGDLFAKVGA